VFDGAQERTIVRTAENSVIRRFEKGEVLFEQGERTDNLPFFCVLSGRFDIIHMWGSHQHRVAVDGEGALIGDVELLLRGENLGTDDGTIRGLAADQTWARVRCAAPGEVLSIWPADFLLEDPAVTLALARNLAKKLMLRSATADPKTILSKPMQVALYLRRVARDIAQNNTHSRSSIPIPMSLSDIAGEVECAKQTVAVTLKELSRRYEGFSHQRSLIVVPEAFLEGPLQLFEE
jgi:CRP-like cAMP-binding protein